MFAERRFKRQNSQKVIGEKPPPKAEFPKGGIFLKRFSLKLFKNHIFSKNNFKKILKSRIPKKALEQNHLQKQNS